MVGVDYNSMDAASKKKFREQHPEEFPIRNEPTNPRQIVDRRPVREIDRGPPKSGWERAKEHIQSGGGKVFGKAKEVGKKGLDRVQEYNRNQLDKEKKERKERPEKRERRHSTAPSQPKSRVSSRDIYKDGVLQERIHYGGPSGKPAKQPRARKGRREDPLGGIGAGMSFRDMMPSSNQGFGLGGMMPDPYGAPAPSRPRKKKSKSQPRRDEPFDYLDHINSWKSHF